MTVFASFWQKQNPPGEVKRFHSGSKVFNPLCFRSKTYKEKQLCLNVQIPSLNQTFSQASVLSRNPNHQIVCGNINLVKPVGHFYYNKEKKGTLKLIIFHVVKARGDFINQVWYILLIGRIDFLTVSHLKTKKHFFTSNQGQTKSA